MAGIGTGYDLSVATFSPDGRVFQVEYAAKAVDASASTIALVCTDGVIVTAGKVLQHKMSVSGTNRRVCAIDEHITVAMAGLLPDAQNLVLVAKKEARRYRRTYGEPIPARVLAQRLALYVHAYTVYWSVRPYGAALLIAAVEETASGRKGILHCVEPSGTAYEYRGHALGQNRQTARTELERLDMKCTCREALDQLALLHQQSVEETTTKVIEVDASWICAESDYKVQNVPVDLVAAAVAKAKETVLAAEA